MNGRNQLIYLQNSYFSGYGGQLNGTVIISDFSRLHFRFRTDSQYPKQGFRAYYKVIKGMKSVHNPSLLDV